MKVELKVKCPKCKAKPGQKCLNMLTNVRRNKAHGVREELAMKSVKKQVKASPKKAKVVVKSGALTPEQKEVVKVIEDKVLALCRRETEFVKPVQVGPVLSVYKFKLPHKVRLSAFEGLSQDFAQELGSESDGVMVKRMPGDTTVSVFVPNKEKKFINYRDTVAAVFKVANEHKDDMAYKAKSGEIKGVALPLNFGLTQSGEQFIENLIDLPHLLIAGTTGGGKSTLLASMIASLGYCMDPMKLKLCLSDTKQVEFTHFEKLPHLLFPVAKDIYESMQQIESLKLETDTRLTLIGAAGVRNIHEYNYQQQQKNGTKLPYIVLIIDELADLLKSDKRDESKLMRDKLGYIVQKARASGVYVIAATQRPSVDVVKGTIKANFPARLSFRLPSQQDSRTVLGTKGAEQLLSRGDMLYWATTRSGYMRLHAPYASLDDLKAAVAARLQMEAAKIASTVNLSRFPGTQPTIQ